MTNARREFPKKERLYPTDKEERTYRRLKERYGIRDALVVRGKPGEDNYKQPHHKKNKSA